MIGGLSTVARRAGPLERAFAVVVLFLSTGALVPLLRFRNTYFSTARLESGDPFIQQMWLLIYLVLAFLLFRQRRWIWTTIRHNQALWALVALTAISAAWSLDPMLTMRRSFALICTTGFGVYLAMRFSRRELVNIVLVAFAAIAALSLVMALAFPELGIYDGWRGVFLHKNHLGRAMAFSTILWTLKIFFDRQRPLVEFSLLGLSALLLVLSNSKSSLVVCIGVLLCIPALRALRTNLGVIGASTMVAGVVAPITGTWLVMNFDQVATALGRDATLTGRAEVWGLVWEWIWRRPLTGYGFSAFWRGTVGPSGEVAAQMGETFVNSHQVALDLWLEIGIGGILLFTVSLVVVLIRSIVLLRRAQGLEGIFPLAFVLYVLLLSMSESLLFAANSFFWMLYVAIAVHLARPVARHAPAYRSTAERVHTLARRQSRCADQPAPPIGKGRRGAFQPIPMVKVRRVVSTLAPPTD